MPDSLLRIAEVMERLGIGRSSAYWLVAAGELPTVRVGRAVRVPESAVAAFIAGGGVRNIRKGTTGDGPATGRKRAASA